MRPARGIAAAVAVLLAGAGLASATPTAPPADPIGDVIASQPPTPPQEAGPSGDVIIGPPAIGSLNDDLVAEVETLDIEDEEEVAEAAPPQPAADPLPRVRHATAILQALDKVTAETIRFEVPVGQQRRWHNLVFRVRACETTAPDEPMRDAMAYLEVRSQPPTRDGRASQRRVFQGWMFASSPSLNPIEHPLYDVWVIACQASVPSTPGARR